MGYTFYIDLEDILICFLTRYQNAVLHIIPLNETHLHHYKRLKGAKRDCAFDKIRVVPDTFAIRASLFHIHLLQQSSYPSYIYGRQEPLTARLRKDI